MLATKITAALKLRGACPNPVGKDRPDGDKNGEFVSLDVLSPDVTGYVVQQTVDHHGRPSLETLYRFSQNLPLAISVVVLHSGVGVDRDERNVRHIHLGQSGSGRWLLNNSGEHITVLNAAGELVDQKHYPANHCDLLPIPVRPPVIVPSVPHFSPWRKR
jgi:hypothetical protein